MNHIVVSDKNYRLFAGTLDECKDFAKDWAIKNKRSPKITSERQYAADKVRQAGSQAELLVLTAVAEHNVDGKVMATAINTLVESHEYEWSNVLKKAVNNQPLSASQIAWIVREAAKVAKARKVTKTLASAVA